MPFAKVDNHVFEKNALVNVVYELRFTPILKIESELPTAFQEEIRNEFPYYEEQKEIQQGIQIGNAGNPMTNLQTTKLHVFMSDDRDYQIGISKTRFVLSTTNYTTFLFFVNKCDEAILAFYRAYTPKICTRVGLRYINVFSRKKLGVDGIPWSELITPPFLGALGSHFSGKVEGMQCKTIVALDDDKSKADIDTSLVFAQEEGSDDRELCFMLNTDFYCDGPMKYSESIGKLGYLHKRATRLLNEVITDKLRDAMGSKELQNDI